MFDVVPRFVLPNGLGMMAVGTRNEIIFSFFAAPGLLHYRIDGHPWKVGSDPELRTYLQLSSDSQPPSPADRQHLRNIPLTPYGLSAIITV